MLNLPHGEWYINWSRNSHYANKARLSDYGALDPALLHPGRLDQKMDASPPNKQGRLDILDIHSSKITKQGDLEYEAMVKLSDGFNGADLRNICKEAGISAIRDKYSFVVP